MFVLAPEDVETYVELGDKRAKAPKSNLIEGILRDFVRLKPEAVEIYAELGDERAKAPLQIF
ncbi:MAG: hypothetical protein IKL79_06175 [Clostridia bacterium]|nr:hypothetical protein [Clostridia bacterium]